MNDDNKLPNIISGTFFTGIGKSLVVFLGLLGFLITARWLTPEELGGFTIIQVAAVFIANFSDFGINTTITKFLADREDQDYQRSLIFTTFTFRLVVLTIAILISILAHRILFSLFGSSFYVDLLPYLPVLVLLEGFTKYFGSVFEGLLRFKWVGFFDALTSVSSFSLILILLVWLDLGLAGRFWVRILALTIPLVIMFILYPVIPGKHIDLGLLKKILKFGFPLYINQILSFIFLRADTFIIGILLGPAEIAIYEIARKIPESLEMLYDAFRKVYFPLVSKLLYKGDREESGGLLNNSTRLLTFASGFMAIFVFMFGEEIIGFLFGNKYQGSGLVFAVLMGALMLLMIDYTLGYTLVAVGEPDKPPLINIVRTGINFIGYFTLIQPLGVLGAALAGIFGTVFVNPINVFFLKRRKVPVNMWNYIKPVLLVLIILLFYWIIPLQTVIIKASLLLLYIGLSFLIGNLTKVDLLSAYDISKKILSQAKNYRDRKQLSHQRGRR